MTRPATLLCLVIVAALCGPARAAGPGTTAGELEIFKTWLEQAHKGYGCDEGPARFRNATVETAYAGRRFYYVLTYTRGIQPPFPNSLSLVAHVAADGGVEPLNPSVPATYRPGLLKVSRKDEARQAAAAVLILAMGDPGEKRWKIQEDSFAVEKSRKGWMCSYQHLGGGYVSVVAFDRDGILSTISLNTPPVA
jgi:hypothetical protein